MQTTEERKAPIMQVGQIYQVKGNDSYYWVCVEKATGDSFQKLQELRNAGAVPDSRKIENTNNSSYLLAIIDAHDFDSTDKMRLCYYDFSSEDGIMLSSQKILVPIAIANAEKAKLPKVVKDMIEPEKQKQFVMNKQTRSLFCVQGDHFVLYDNEIDNRGHVGSLVVSEYNQLLCGPFFEPIDISYEVYLKLTGLKRRTKETDLAELKAAIFTEHNLGCQREALTPIIQDLLSFCEKYVGLKYQSNVHAAIYKIIDILTGGRLPEIVDMDSQTYTNRAVKSIEKYVKRLKED